MRNLPGSARVVIVGGGIAGCSIAYHLAKLGMTDVVLLERATLSSGTTWHSAGNMETYRDDPLTFDMVQYAIKSFPGLENETGQQLGWRGAGRVMFSHLEERIKEFQSLPEIGRLRGVELEFLSPKGLAERLPILDTDKLLGGVWVPGDGSINPTDLVTAYAKGARTRGVHISENTAVQAINTRNGRITQVITEKRVIDCDCVVVAGGLWSNAIVNLCGAALPLHALEHMYMVTEPIATLHRMLPLFVSYDDQLYGREDVGGLLVGCLDDNALPLAESDLPDDFAFSLLNERWEQFEPYMLRALERFPVLRTAGIKMLLNGPESFTPDNKMLLGPVASIDGLYTACGFNSNGIALSPAAGRYMAEWLIEGEPSVDVSRIDARRFSAIQSSRAYMRERVTEVSGYECRMHHLGDDYKTCRNIRVPATHEICKQRGANFVSVGGWEVPLLFRARPDESAPDCVSAEVATVESGVLIVDRSTFAAWHCSGPDIRSWLAARSAVPIAPNGSYLPIVPLLDFEGRIAALVRIIFEKSGAALLLAEPEQETLLSEWVRTSVQKDLFTVREMTGAYNYFELLGTARQPMLQQLSIADADARWLGATRINIYEDFSRDLSFVVTTCDIAGYALESLLNQKGTLVALGGQLSAEALRIRRGTPAFGREITQFSRADDIRLAQHPLQDSLAAVLNAPGAHSRRMPQRIVALQSAPSHGIGLSSEAIVSNDRVVGSITSTAWLPGWPSTLLLARIDANLDTDTQIETVLGGRRERLFCRKSPYQELSTSSVSG